MPQYGRFFLNIQRKITLSGQEAFSNPANPELARCPEVRVVSLKDRLNDRLLPLRRLLQGLIQVKSVEVNGGLGNQMFQYAFYLSLKDRWPGDSILLDTFSYLLFLKRGTHERYSLDETFNLMRPNRWLAYMVHFSKKISLIIHVPELIHKPYVQEFHPSGSVVFSGFWQSEKYFVSIEEKVRSLFTFRQTDTPECLTILEDIHRKTSVSIHVRRGDYCEKPFYCDLCDQGYYDAAISHIERSVPNAQFFVFSDDTRWCKKIFTGDQFIVVECNNARAAYLDMFLMTQCKHNIIANSTFSWWGAWLNQNPDKIVVTPKEWFSVSDDTHDMDDILPESWIRIDTSKNKGSE